MKRLFFAATVLAISACNSAAKEQARQDSIATAAAAEAMQMQKAQDSVRRADSIKAAESKMKSGAKTSPTKSKTAPKTKM